MLFCKFFPNIKFDVIVGKPPYKLNVGVEKENYAIALYGKIVMHARKYLLATSL